VPEGSKASAQKQRVIEGSKASAQKQRVVAGSNPPIANERAHIVWLIRTRGMHRGKWYVIARAGNLAQWLLRFFHS
jgi:hypothetical protein